MRGIDLAVVAIIFAILCAVYAYDRWVRRTDKQ